MTKQLEKSLSKKMEGGIWGIVIVASAFLIQVFAFGVSASIGVYNIEFLNYFDNDTVGVSLIAAINWATFLGAGPVASFLMTKTSYRKIALLGSIMVVMGIFLMPFIPYIPAFCICFGFLTGLGACLVYVPSHVLSGLYYERHQSLSTGIATSGSGLGGAVMPIVIGKLIEHYGWKGSLIVVAGMELHLIVCAALLRAPPKSTQKRKDSKMLALLEQEKSEEELVLALDDVKEQSLRKKSSGAELASPECTDILFEREGSPVDGNKTTVLKTKMVKAVDSTPDDIKCSKESLTVFTSEKSSAIGSTPLLSEIEIAAADTNPESASFLAANCDVHGMIQASINSGSSSHKNVDDPPSDSNGNVKILRHIYLFTDVGFNIYFVSSVFWNAAAAAVLSFGPEMTTEYGMSVLDSAWLLTIFGFGDFLGSLLGGAMGNIWTHRRQMQYVVANILFGITIAACPFGSTFGGFTAVLLICGISFGVILGLLVVVLTDLIGSDNLADGLGYVMLANGVGAFAGPGMTGYIRKVSGSYDLAFYIAGVLAVLAGVIMWLIPIIKHFFPETETPKRSHEAEAVL